MSSLIEHAQTITVEGLRSNKQDAPDGASCFVVSARFPASRGVVEFVADDGSTVLLAATGNMRRFIADRLNEDGQSSPKANLAPIAARIIAYPTGSAFESDWIVLERARRVDPELLAKLNDQNQRAFLVLDPNTSTWRVDDTRGLSADPSERVIGPILTGKAARLLGETLDDVYELCRYPKELALAPNGCACAYKEMGRCPGVCDGSEPMEVFRARFSQALNAASVGTGAWGEQLGAEIADASDAMDFERAQRTKRSLDAIEKLPIEAVEHAGAIDGFACVCITPSVRKGWAMVWGFDASGLVPMLSTRDDAAGVEGMIERWASASFSVSASPNQSPNQVWLDRFALISRHWFTKPARARRRRVTILDLRHSCLGGKIIKAISQAAAVVELGCDDEEQTHIRG